MTPQEYSKLCCVCHAIFQYSTVTTLSETAVPFHACLCCDAVQKQPSAHNPLPHKNNCPVNLAELIKQQRQRQERSLHIAPIDVVNLCQAYLELNMTLESMKLIAGTQIGQITQQQGVSLHGDQTIFYTLKDIAVFAKDLKCKYDLLNKAQSRKDKWHGML
jgi:hypothetical protein